MTTFLFVGERPSQLAARIGATWENGKLAAKQLHDALRALNIEPKEHLYINLWTRPTRNSEADAGDEEIMLRYIRHAHDVGSTIVGMGAIVCRVLSRENIPHLQMIHPAARGAIRRKDRYTAHVGSVLARPAVGKEPHHDHPSNQPHAGPCG